MNSFKAFWILAVMWGAAMIGSEGVVERRECVQGSGTVRAWYGKLTEAEYAKDERNLLE